MLGDFNIPSMENELFAAITAEGLRIPSAHLGFTGTNLAKNKRYDQILNR